MNSIISELEAVFKSKRPDDVESKIRFPRGVIPYAESYRQHLSMIKDRVLKSNIAYTLQFGTVYRWILEWFDIDLTAKQMLIKHGIVLYTSVSEALVHYFVDNYLRGETVNKKFKKNLEKLRNHGIINNDEFNESDNCRKTRDKIHLQNQFVREWEEYSENDFCSAWECMNKLNKRLTAKARRLDS